MPFTVHSVAIHQGETATGCFPLVIQYSLRLLETHAIYRISRHFLGGFHIAIPRPHLWLSSVERTCPISCYGSLWGKLWKRLHLSIHARVCTSFVVTGIDEG